MDRTPDASPQARRHVRLFQLHQFLDRLAMGLTVAVVALALTDRGVDLFGISLLFGVYSVTTMVLELPFGGLADSIGRKPVFLLAVVASLISLALFLSSSAFPVLALSFAFIGFGRALRSGTLDAWFVETFRAKAPGNDIQPALAGAQWAGALGLAVGAVLGGLLPDLFGPLAQTQGFSPYDTSYMASFAAMLGVFAYTLVFIEETPRSRHPGALRQGFASIPAVIRDAGRLAVRHPVLPLLLAAQACFLMASNPVEVLWPTHAKPMLDAGLANTAIGLLTASYFFAIALGGWLSPHASKLFRRNHARLLAGAFACLALVQVALALQGQISGFAAMFLLYSVLLGLCETPASSILHGHTPDHQRSTMLSLRSLIQQLGAALGLILTGAIAELWSTPTAFIAASGFLLAAALLITNLARRSAGQG